MGVEITEAQRAARRKNIRVCLAKQVPPTLARNPRWGGGAYVASDGYCYVRVGNRGSRTVYRLAHRLVMEQAIGRLLRRDEHVHHKNGIKSDNRLANLQLLSVADHARLHAATVAGRAKIALAQAKRWPK